MTRARVTSLGTVAKVTAARMSSLGQTTVRRRHNGCLTHFGVVHHTSHGRASLPRSCDGSVGVFHESSDEGVDGGEHLGGLGGSAVDDDREDERSVAYRGSVAGQRPAAKD